MHVVILNTVASIASKLQRTIDSNDDDDDDNVSISIDCFFNNSISSSSDDDVFVKTAIVVINVHVF